MLPETIDGPGAQCIEALPPGPPRAITPRRAVLIAIGALVVLGLCFIGWRVLYGLGQMYAWYDTMRDVDTVAEAVGNLYARNPSANAADVQAVLAGLPAPNSREDGRPRWLLTDVFGTPFRITREVIRADGRTWATTTAISAGPDRRFGTEDDLTGTRQRTVRTLPPDSE